MLTAKARLASTARASSADRPTHTSTSGGSSEREENAFAVMPQLAWGPCVVITVTPVAKAPSTRRSSVVENAGGEISGTRSPCPRVTAGSASSPRSGVSAPPGDPGWPVGRSSGGTRRRAPTAGRAPGNGDGPRSRVAPLARGGDGDPRGGRRCHRSEGGFDIDEDDLRHRGSRGGSARSAQTADVVDERVERRAREPADAGVAAREELKLEPVMVWGQLGRVRIDHAPQTVGRRRAAARGSLEHSAA